jgi:hypothetical protein
MSYASHDRTIRPRSLCISNQFVQSQTAEYFPAHQRRDRTSKSSPIVRFVFFDQLDDLLGSRFASLCFASLCFASSFFNIRKLVIAYEVDHEVDILSFLVSLLSRECMTNTFFSSKVFWISSIMGILFLFSIEKIRFRIPEHFLLSKSTPLAEQCLNFGQSTDNMRDFREISLSLFSRVIFTWSNQMAN